MADFSKAKIGDRVFCAFGPDVKIGETNAIIEVMYTYHTCPITIITDGPNLNIFTFTIDGYHTLDGQGMPTLFWSKPEYIDPPMPKRKVKKYVAGFYDSPSVIMAHGHGMKMSLFDSKEEIFKRETDIAFIAEVEVDEKDC